MLYIYIMYIYISFHYVTPPTPTSPKNPQFILYILASIMQLIPLTNPYRLTFTWWECYGLCQRHKPTELAHSFFYSALVYVSVFMALSTYFIP